MAQDYAVSLFTMLALHRLLAFFFARTGHKLTCALAPINPGPAAAEINLTRMLTITLGGNHSTWPNESLRTELFDSYIPATFQKIILNLFLTSCFSFSLCSLFFMFILSFFFLTSDSIRPSSRFQTSPRSPPSLHRFQPASPPDPS